MNVMSLDRDVPEVWTLGPAVEALRRGHLIVIPTDTIYALACDPWNASAVGALYKAKNMEASKRCAIACADLKAVGSITRAVSDEAFRFLRTHLPGPYTVLLHASRDLPRKATGKRKSIGVRIPNHPVSAEIIEQFGPILVSSLPGWEGGEGVDPVEIARRLPVRPAVVIDQGVIVPSPSTVVDFSVDPPELIRQGAGEVDVYEFDA